jgi:orotate phosphoribosyltransferase
MAATNGISDVIRGYRDRLLALLRERAYERRDVVLASGRRSNFYIDCRRVVMTAEGHFLTGLIINDVIRRECPDAVAVGGLTLGADPLASAASLMSLFGGHPLDAFYVRKEPKKHGTAQYVEGAAHLAEGAPVVIVEDVVTTGGSSLKAVERAEAAGLKPSRIVALVDRCEGGRATIEERIPLTSLFSRTDFPE